MTRARQLLPLLWSCALALLLLGPALAPGYVLTYDMVWVPDLTMRPDFLGLGSGLPRAVPSDAVIAVLDTVLPGQVLQKCLLVGCLVGGGLGCARLVPGGSLAGRLVAVSLYQWNPYVTERLFMGHWPLLVGYATLPWVVGMGQRWRAGGRMPVALLVLLPLGSLSANAGLMTAFALLVFTGGRGTEGARRTLMAAGLGLAANAPWLMAGLLHVSSATSDADAADLFGLEGFGSVPGPVAALSWGGIWNDDVVLPTRGGLLEVGFLALLLGLVVLGARSWAARTDARDRRAYGACWLLGYALAVVTWAFPDAVGWLATTVPGAGLLRDGTRWLALCVLPLVVVAARGAAVLAARIPDGVPRVVLAGAVAVLPLTLIPDAALGLSGRLASTTYPPVYDEARAEVPLGAGGVGDVLALPLTSYRAPDWNGDRKVLDPVGRYLPRDYVASDDLVVGGRTIAGEDPRVREVRAALRAPTPEARARALAALGVGFVVTGLEVAGEAPEVAGDVLVDRDGLRLQRLDGVTPPTTPYGWVVAMAVAWALYGGQLLLALALGLRRQLNARRRSTPS